MKQHSAKQVCSQHAHQRGFTLTEALIAIAILAGIAAAMAPALQGTLRVAKRIHGTSNIAENHRIAGQILTRLFDGVVQLPATKTPPLIGAPQALTFMTYGITLKKPQSMQLYIVNNNTKQQLVLSDGKESDPISLMTGMDLQFSYFGPVGQNNTLNWQTRWQEKTPPWFIRFEGVKENQKTILFEFAMQARDPLICRFDAVSRRCREG